MEHKKRLVNAEAIARKLKNAYCAECNVVRKIQCSACWVDDVLELLEGDTVDAVEVVHGRWVEHRPNVYECTACHTWYGNYGGCEEWAYCPNCGAKMDGGNEDA